MKIKTARKNYPSCFECKLPIDRGSSYIRRTKSMGNPRLETTDFSGGVPATVIHGFHYDLKYHSDCFIKDQK